MQLVGRGLYSRALWRGNGLPSESLLISRQMLHPEIFPTYYEVSLAAAVYLPSVLGRFGQPHPLASLVRIISGVKRKEYACSGFF